VVVNPPSGLFLRVYDSPLPWNFSPTELRTIAVNRHAANKMYGGARFLYTGETIDKTIHGMAGEARVKIAHQAKLAQAPQEVRVYEDVSIPEEAPLLIGGQTQIRYNEPVRESVYALAPKNLLERAA
jgi:hypothetical protein